MRKILRVLAWIGLALALSGGPVMAQTGTEGALQITQVVNRLQTPWAIAFLPDGRALITERRGRLLLVQDGQARSVQGVRGVPDVAAQGQGGLLDVMVPRDFATSRAVFLTYAKVQPGGGAGTALSVGRLSEDGRRLEDLRLLFEAPPGWSGGRHFGSRVVEAPDGTLFLTLGERGDRSSAQDRGNTNGSILRLNRDGSVPADNPFVGQAGIRPEIWSFGHRNPQGAALDATGQLWAVEHGARGGDEINLIRKGANYGWPVISYGTHYSGEPIGEGQAKPGMEQPAFYWDPSIAPSGMTIYDGRLIPGWRGSLLVGSLKFNYIARLAGTPLREVGQIRSAATRRVRDVAQAPDGSLWFLSEGNGAAYRIAPAE